MLTGKITQLLTDFYNQEIPENLVQLQKTRKEFDGDLTLVTFPLLRTSKKSPEETAKELGVYLEENLVEVTAFNVVKGFLNLSISDSFWLSKFETVVNDENYGFGAQTNETYIVEYASPNTNKPLHLGHLRNVFLGYSVAEILKANGHDVVKTQIINDRGIHICKSMVAWQKFGEGETPTSSGLKGDKLVGKYYVAFDKEYKKQLNDLKEKAIKEYNSNSFGTGDSFTIPKYKPLNDAFDRALILFLKNNNVSIGENSSDSLNMKDVGLYKGLPISSSVETANQKKYFKLKEDFVNVVFDFNFIESSSKNVKDKKGKEIIELCEKELERIVPIFVEAQEMLVKWEAKDPEVYKLWETMNSWCYDGFEVTYNEMGVDFDKLYYESNTYLLGKNIVEDGLKSGVLYRKEDNSVWCDLSDTKLDDKLLLRGDGTSVYMTQDIGTAVERFKDFPSTKGMVYTVGNEQDHHFKVLFTILKKLGYPFADNCFHLSYGMVDLPSGKMKSREGTVVDADDLMADVVNDAKQMTQERGHLDGMSDTEKDALYNTIGMGGLKYYLLKVDPKKRMLFNPEESVDLNGNTGPFIQYGYARIQSILRKNKPSSTVNSSVLEPAERELVKLMLNYPETIIEAGKNYSPAILSNYTYDLVKTFNSFYQSVPILREEDKEKLNTRLLIIQEVASIIKRTMQLIGVEVPNQM